MTGRKYAHGTTVPAAKSKGEIEAALISHGADQFSAGWTDKKSVIMFRMGGRYIRIEMPMPSDDPAEERRRWRAMLLYVKAKLESVESDILTFEEAFMSHIVLPNRQTVGQFMHDQIENAYSSGKMPKALPGY